MLSVLTLDESIKWDSIVRSFAKHDVYYLSGYVKAFQINGDGEPIFVYYEDDTIKAINVLMRRDIASHPSFSGKVENGKYFDTVTPYGYGGFLIEAKEGQHPDITALNEVYADWCVREGIICEFVRFHPLLRNWVGLECMYEVTHHGDTVSLDTSSEEVIWQNISSKCRNMIRKASKAGVKIYWGRNSSIISSFMDIYNATMEKDDAKDYYFFDENFYTSILDDLKHNAMWFCAKTEDVITSIAIFMFCNGKMHYHLAASRKEYQHLATSNLLLYEAATWAFKNGYKQLHLGGGGRLYSRQSV